MALGKECKERGRQLPANRNNSSQTGKCRTFAPSEAFLKSFFFFFFSLSRSEACSGSGWFLPSFTEQPVPSPPPPSLPPTLFHPPGASSALTSCPFPTPEKGNAFLAVSACAAVLSSPFLCLSCLTINLGLGDCPCTTAAFDCHPEKPYFVRPVTLIDMMIILTINICNKVRRLTRGGWWTFHRTVGPGYKTVLRKANFYNFHVYFAINYH